jgi:hypothetical protein
LFGSTSAFGRQLTLSWLLGLSEELTKVASIHPTNPESCESYWKTYKDASWAHAACSKIHASGIARA